MKATPLTRRTALVARTPLGRSAPLRARRLPKPGRPVDTGPSAATRAAVRARSEGLCEWPSCHQPATDVHHRLGRGMGSRFGPALARINSPANLLDVCRPHHRQVTSPFGPRLLLARQSGWLLLEHQDPTLVPVHTRHAVDPVWLTAEGSYATEPPEVA